MNMILAWGEVASNCTCSDILLLHAQKHAIAERVVVCIRSQVSFLHMCHTSRQSTEPGENRLQ